MADNSDIDMIKFLHKKMDKGNSDTDMTTSDTQKKETIVIVNVKQMDATKGRRGWVAPVRHTFLESEIKQMQEILNKEMSLIFNDKLEPETMLNQHVQILKLAKAMRAVLTSLANKQDVVEGNIIDVYDRSDASVWLDANVKQFG